MIRFSGSREEFGRFHGEWLRKVRHDFCNSLTKSQYATLRKQMKIYETYYPELVVELIAAAESINLNPDLILYEDLARFVDAQRERLELRKHGCTIFALHENGKTFVGRNYDWLPEARDFFEYYNLDIQGANRCFIFSDESVWMRHTGIKHRKMYAEDAINEHGLYIGLTYAHIDKWNYGLSPSHIIRCIAEKCRTTRQALNAFAKIPCAIPKNYLIADKTGDLATVEHAAKFFEVVRPDARGVLVQTNHCLAPKLLSLDQVYKRCPRADSFLRYEEARHLVAMQLPGFQFTDLWRILRQSHYVYNEETIWSLALELSESRLNLYYDTAQGQKQRKFGFEE